MRAGRLLRTTAAAVLVLLTAGAPALGQPSAPQPTTTQPTSRPSDPADPPPTTRGENQVTISLDAIGPASLVPDSTLTVRASVHNGTATTLEEPAVRLSVRRQRLASRTDLQTWADGDTRAGPVVAAPPSTGPLAPGATRTVELTAEAGDLDLPGSPFQWGPRGLEVTVGDGGDTLARARSFVVWEPASGGYEPTRLSLLVPLTDGPPDVLTGRLPPEVVEEQTGTDGRLSNVLAAAAQPGVTWAVDPALVEAVAGAGPAGGTADGMGADTQDGTEDGTDGAAPFRLPGPAAAEWFTDLQVTAPGREVIALPYGDPDVAALVRARQQRVYRFAETLGGDTGALLGVPVRDDIAWPVSGTLDDATLTAVSTSGRNAVVLSGGAQPPTESLTSTPTGRSRVPAVPEPVAGLLVDTSLSTTLARTDPATGSGADDDSLEPRTPATTVQRLLAETAAVTMERPFDPRHVLVTAPRGWDPDPDAAVAAVRALTAAPWVDPRPVGELLATEPPSVRRDGLVYPDDDRADELSAEVLADVAEALNRAVTTSALLADPQEATAAARRRAVAAASAAWRDRRDEWTEQVAELAERAAQRAQAVSVLPGSSLNVVSSDVRLPVTVANQLDEPVRVQVRLRPRTSRLVVEDTVTVRIPARSQTRVSVPVKAVGNGDTDVGVELLTPGGEPLSAPATLTVRVRADWETWGTLTIGTGVVLILLFGLVRGIRRGRRQRALEDPVAGFQAVPSAEPEAAPASDPATAPQPRVQPQRHPRPQRQPDPQPDPEEPRP